MPCPGPSSFLQVERVRLENEYQSKLGVMSGELDRMREELAMRTMVMSEEMERCVDETLT